MTFVVSNELFVEEADTEIFEKNFSAAMRATLSGVPGLITAHLLAPVESGRGYLSVLRFENQTAYSNYLESEAFVAAHRWPDHAPISDARLTTYETIVEV